MAGEHIELVPLDLLKLDNSKLNNNCNMISKLDDRMYKKRLNNALESQVAD